MDRGGDDPGLLPDGLDRRRLLGLLAVAALLALAGCEGPTYRHTVCGVCENGPSPLEEGATVESSEMEIQTFENGTARWTARMDVSGADAEAIAARTDAVATAIEEDFDDEDYFVTAHRGEVRNVSVRADGETLVATYLVPDTATVRPDGYLVVKQFHGAHVDFPEYSKAYGLGADRLRVKAPSGMRVVNDPPGGGVIGDGRWVVWADDPTVEYDAYSVPLNTYVVFGPERTPTQRAAGQAVVAHETLAWGGPGVVFWAGVVAGIVGLLLGVIGDLATGGRLRRWIRRPSVDARQRPWTLGAVAVVLLASAVHVGLGEPSEPLVEITGVTLGLVAITASGLGVATARDHWSGLPLGSFLLALPIYVMSMAVFDVGGGSILALWALPAVPLAALAFVVGFKLGGGNFRGD